MEENKGVWLATRLCFYLMAVSWVFSAVILAVDEENILGSIFSVLLVLLIIPTFVLSIIHLRRYKDKGVAVTALVISSVGLFFVFIGFMAGLLLV